MVARVGFEPADASTEPITEPPRPAISTP